jgi:hypothetical protein
MWPEIKSFFFAPPVGRTRNDGGAKKKGGPEIRPAS